MISYFMFGTNNFRRALDFYTQLMREMGAQKVYETDKTAGWGWGSPPGPRSRRATLCRGSGGCGGSACRACMASLLFYDMHAPHA